MTGMDPSSTSRSRRFDLRQLAWYKLLAPYTLLFLLCCYTIMQVGRFGFFNSLLDLVYCFWSLRFVLLLPLVFMLPCVRRRWLASLCLIPIFVFMLWQLASLELYAVQIRFLSFTEISYLLSEPSLRPIFWEQILSFRVFLFFACVLVLYFGLDALAEKYAKSHWVMLIVPFLVAVLSFGEYMASLQYRNQHVFHGHAKVCMPWCSMNPYIQKRPLPNVARAQELLHRRDGPLWEDGPSPLFSAIPDRYHGRNIVVVLLESHSLRLVQGLGDGAQGHKPMSPYLASLYQSGIGFTNYLQSGFSTSSAAWSILSSAPYYLEAAYSPHLSAFGLVDDFKKAGYEIDWLKAADIKFAHFHELTQNLGIEAGASEEEKARMKSKDPRYWSAWGMPDEQIFELSLERIRKKNAADKKYLHFVLTVSNHIPYSFPDKLGEESLARDHYGGVRYVDACLESYMTQLMAMDASERPLVFITADTAYRTGFYITRDDIEAPVEPLESIRLPGVLLLPDGDHFIERVDELFTHQDLLPMLARLVGVEHDLVEHYMHKHRFAVPVQDIDGFSIISEKHYLFGNMALLEQQSYWNYDFIEKDAAAGKRLEECFHYLKQTANAIWNTDETGVNVRDQNWDAIDSYPYYKK